MKKKLSAAMATVVGVVSLMLLGTPNALAYGPSYCKAPGCDLSGAPNTGQIFFSMPGGTPLTMLCWTDSQWYNGTNRWFKVSSQYPTGYVIATQVGAQTTVGHC